MNEMVEQLGWIDLSVLIILAVFLVLGICRGLIWQLTRLLTIAVGYVLAGIWADDLRQVLVEMWPQSAQYALFAAYFAIFVAVVVVLSALAYLVMGLIKKLKLSAYNRLGGGVMGLATGAVLIILGLNIIYAFFGPHTGIVMAAENSRSKPAAVSTLKFLQDHLEFSFLSPVITNLDREKK